MSNPSSNFEKLAATEQQWLPIHFESQEGGPSMQLSVGSKTGLIRVVLKNNDGREMVDYTQNDRHETPTFDAQTGVGFGDKNFKNVDNLIAKLLP